MISFTSVCWQCRILWVVFGLSVFFSAVIGADRAGLRSAGQQLQLCAPATIL